MATRTRLNLYFDPALIPQIEAMALRRSVALRRNVSKSAIVEAAVMSYLSGDADDQRDIYMNVDGGAPQLATKNTNGYTTNYAWNTPDGEHLFFTTAAPAVDDGDTTSDVFQNTGGTLTRRPR